MRDSTLDPPIDRLTVGGDEMAIQVTSDVSDGSLLAYDVWLAPGGGPPALHRHAAFELFRVQRGELAFYLEDGHGSVARSVAGPGTVVAIPGGREHTVRNESGQRAHAFVVLSPGDEMERFARAAGALDPDDASLPAKILAVAAAHGIEITRPLEEVVG